eukprot:TRINITY_DN16208_c0_g1_i1.p2 TRINITY_DN16208_c0_g1~~TRINITY_DN16208_c0_g1_i1.p2  ORF type:complete len:158 (-),score=35.38 TRINITY_DN16208_c0_g1_i1:75-509(-)
MARLASFPSLMAAVLAGCFGCLSGILGKLSVQATAALLQLSFLQGYFAAFPLWGERLLPAVRVLCFVGNGACTGLMWRYYLLSLANLSSAKATMLNTSVNFTLTAVLSALFFGEAIPAEWFLGAALIVAGLFLIIRGEVKESVE